MTEHVERLAERTREHAGQGDGSRGAAAQSLGLKDMLTTSPAADRLKQEASAFASAQAERLLAVAGRGLGTVTARLTDVAEGKSGGLGGLALRGGKKLAEGKGIFRSVVETGAGSLKDKAKDSVKGLFGGGEQKATSGGEKFVSLIEDVDVGVPLREAYNQWTQYEEFSTFTKAVQGVEQKDEVTTDWRAKILWSNRSWKATITEQVPDQRISWTSEGPKGTNKGTVTFHPLSENLTKVLLVIEYYPQGFFEKTGNLWRAQGRRARLDLKHFRRFVMMRNEATGAWRGEIRDGEVVRGHDEVVARERRDAEDQPAQERYSEGDQGAAEDEYDEGEEEAKAPSEDEAADAAYDDDTEEDEYDEEDEGDEYQDFEGGDEEDEYQETAEGEHARR